MKINLDVAALQKVIELQGPEFILELRQGILAEVVKRTVTQIVPAEAQRVMNAEAKRVVTETVGYIESQYPYKVVIQPELAQRIQRAVYDGVQEAAHKLIDQAKINEQIEMAIRIVNSQVASKIEKLVVQRMAKDLDEIIAKEVDRRFNERLQTLNLTTTG